MLPPSSQKKSSQREDFDLGPIIQKNNPHRRGILTWAHVPPIISKIILLIEGYLHVSTFYSEVLSSIKPKQGLTCCHMDLVVVCNSTSGTQSAQSSCQSLTKTHSYASISWFT